MKITWFKIFNKISILTLSFLLISSFTLTIPAGGKYPAEKKGRPEYYARDERLGSLEDLFFPHDFKLNRSYVFKIPEYLKNTSYGYFFLLDEEYRYQALRDDEDENALPPDFMHANLTIKSSDNEYIFSKDNKHKNVGGGAVEGIDFTGKKNVSIMMTGGLEFFIFEYPGWDDILYKKQTISFNGIKRSFLLWDVDSGIKDFDSQEYYIRLKINTDKPVRSYVFENTGKHEGELIDYDEKKTTSKQLDLIDRDKNVGIVCEPKIAFSTIDGKRENINISLEVNILEIPENMWLLPVIVGGVFVFVVGAALWVNRKKS